MALAAEYADALVSSVMLPAWLLLAIQTLPAPSMATPVGASKLVAPPEILTALVAIVLAVAPAADMAVTGNSVTLLLPILATQTLPAWSTAKVAPKNQTIV